jgi:hypothetical protein
MTARMIADLLVAVHFAFIVFAAFGGLLALKWRKAAFLHVPCAIWGALIEFAGWFCPLTTLENRFREKAGMCGYSGGFIDHYLVPLVYPEGLTRELQMWIGVVVLAFNLSIYGLLFVRQAKRQRS